MSVQLDPLELGFRRPFNQEVTETLRLKNPGSDPIAFKVKTTAPKQYCVRPNSGRIDPGQQVEVQVLLQAMKEDPPMEAKCRDKFLVQSVAVPANQEFTNAANIWQAVEQTAKSSVNEKKIRVNFLPAHGTAPVGAGAADTPARRGGEEEPPAYSSPASHAGTPAQSRDTMKDVSSTPSGSSGTYTGAAGGAIGAAAAALPSNTEELKQQLAEARQRITTLTQQAADNAGLRQRKTASSDGRSPSTSSSVSAQQAPGGVPMHMVAIMCLISFLLAYLLF